MSQRWQRLKAVRRHHGLTAAAGWLTRHALCWAARTEVNEVLCLQAADLQRPSELADAVRLGWLTGDELAAMAGDAAWDLGPSFLPRLAAGHDRCWGAWCGGRLAGYSWYATGSIEPEHAAGIALGLPHDMAYMYKALTRSEFRGRGLYGRAIAGALRELEAEGITRLVALVDWTNLDSLAGCRKLGFRSLGRLVRREGRREPTFRLPREAARAGLRFGDAADLSPRRGSRMRSAEASDSSQAENGPAAPAAHLAEVLR